ncbi:hypothetical protein IEQ34_019788 [Dendrobium chrysotoxum]|uniref:Uncharacterized protein n=1 Tax=Dendrobium chrysotoxum TaxID=161865 RepID=A0AAV7FSE7_DENCH|nr:hypothetical protein IEQ34_019788 [Dendrobium chrysotoxum]
MASSFSVRPPLLCSPYNASHGRKPPAAGRLSVPAHHCFLLFLLSYCLLVMKRKSNSKRRGKEEENNYATDLCFLCRWLSPPTRFGTEANP